MSEERITVADGKYTVINDNGNLSALRHGEPWARDLVGDNLVYWLFVRIRELEALAQQAQEPAANERDCPHCNYTGSMHCGDVAEKYGGILNPQDCSHVKMFGSRATTPQPQPASVDELPDLNPEDFVVDVVLKQIGGFAPVTTHGVRVTHKPSHISVVVDSERSQHRNRQLALEALRAITHHQAHPVPAPVDAPKCRDCADFGPICPNSGKPCTAPPAQAGEVTREQMVAAVRPLCNTDAVAEKLVDVSMDEYRAILALRQAVEADDDVCLPRRLAATQKLKQLGYRFDASQGQWLPATTEPQAVMRPQTVPMTDRTLALLADITPVEHHDSNGPGSVECPACSAYMHMRWKAGARTDELGQLPHDEDCPAEWARRQLANGITAKAEGAKP